MKKFKTVNRILLSASLCVTGISFVSGLDNMAKIALLLFIAYLACEREYYKRMLKKDKPNVCKIKAYKFL